MNNTHEKELSLFRKVEKQHMKSQKDTLNFLIQWTLVVHLNCQNFQFDTKYFEGRKFLFDKKQKAKKY